MIGNAVPVQMALAIAQVVIKDIKDFILQSQTGVNGKLWQFARVLSGEKFDVFDAIELDKLINSDCIISVEQKEHINVVTEYISLDNFKDIS